MPYSVKDIIESPSYLAAPAKDKLAALNNFRDAMGQELVDDESKDAFAREFEPVFQRTAANAAKEDWTAENGGLDDNAYLAEHAAMRDAELAEQQKAVEEINARKANIKARAEALNKAYQSKQIAKENYDMEIGRLLNENTALPKVADEMIGGLARDINSRRQALETRRAYDVRAADSYFGEKQQSIKKWEEESRTIKDVTKRALTEAETAAIPTVRFEAPTVPGWVPGKEAADAILAAGTAGGRAGAKLAGEILDRAGELLPPAPESGYQQRPDLSPEAREEFNRRDLQAKADRAELEKWQGPKSNVVPGTDWNTFTYQGTSVEGAAKFQWRQKPDLQGNIIVEVMPKSGKEPFKMTIGSVNDSKEKLAENLKAETQKPEFVEQVFDQRGWGDWAGDFVDLVGTGASRSVASWGTSMKQTGVVASTFMAPFDGVDAQSMRDALAISTEQEKYDPLISPWLDERAQAMGSLPGNDAMWQHAALASGEFAADLALSAAVAKMAPKMRVGKTFSGPVQEGKPFLTPIYTSPVTTSRGVGALMGLKTAAPTSIEMLEKGFSPSEATVVGMSNALWQSVSEAYGTEMMGQIYNRAFGPKMGPVKLLENVKRLKQLSQSRTGAAALTAGEAYGTEFTENMVQGWGEELIKMAAGDPDAKFASPLDKENFIAGLSGAMIGGPAAGAAFVRGGKQAEMAKQVDEVAENLRTGTAPAETPAAPAPAPAAPTAPPVPFGDTEAERAEAETILAGARADGDVTASMAKLDEFEKAALETHPKQIAAVERGAKELAEGETAEARQAEVDKLRAEAAEDAKLKRARLQEAVEQTLPPVAVAAWKLEQAEAGGDANLVREAKANYATLLTAKAVEKLADAKDAAMLLGDKEGLVKVIETHPAYETEEARNAAIAQVEDAYAKRLMAMAGKGDEAAQALVWTEHLQAALTAADFGPVIAGQYATVKGLTPVDVQRQAARTIENLKHTAQQAGMSKEQAAKHAEARTANVFSWREGANKKLISVGLKPLSYDEATIIFLGVTTNRDLKERAETAVKEGKRGKKVEEPQAADELWKTEEAVPTEQPSFETAKGSQYWIDEKGRSARLKKSAGKAQGKLHRRSPVVFISAEAAEQLLMTPKIMGSIVLVRKGKDGKAEMYRPTADTDIRGETILVGLKDRASGKVEYVEQVKNAPQLGLHPLEIFYEGDLKGYHLGNEIVKVNAPAQAEAASPTASPAPFAPEPADLTLPPPPALNISSLTPRARRALDYLMEQEQALGDQWLDPEMTLPKNPSEEWFVEKQAEIDVENEKLRKTPGAKLKAPVRRAWSDYVKRLGEQRWEIVDAKFNLTPDELELVKRIVLLTESERALQAPDFTDDEVAAIARGLIEDWADLQTWRKVMDTTQGRPQVATADVVGKTARQAAEVLSSHPDSRVSGLAKTILKFATPALDEDVVKRARLIFTQAEATRGRGVINIRTKKNIDALTLLHEIVHSLTGDVLDNDVERYARERGIDPAHIQGEGMKQMAQTLANDPKADPFTRRVAALWLHAAKQLGLEGKLFGARGIASQRAVDMAAFGEVVPYGMANLDEFVAEALSDEDFQEKLDSVEGLDTLEPGSLWRQVVDLVAKLFGVKRSALSQLMAALMETKQRRGGILARYPGLERLVESRTQIDERGPGALYARGEVGWVKNLKGRLERLINSEIVFNPGEIERKIKQLQDFITDNPSDLTEEDLDRVNRQIVLLKSDSKDWVISPYNTVYKITSAKFPNTYVTINKNVFEDKGNTFNSRSLLWTAVYLQGTKGDPGVAEFFAGLEAGRDVLKETWVKGVEEAYPSGIEPGQWSDFEPPVPFVSGTTVDEVLTSLIERSKTGTKHQKGFAQAFLNELVLLLRSGYYKEAEQALMGRQGGAAQDFQAMQLGVNAAYESLREKLLAMQPSPAAFSLLEESVNSIMPDDISEAIAWAEKNPVDEVVVGTKLVDDLLRYRTYIAKMFKPEVVTEFTSAEGEQVTVHRYPSVMQAGDEQVNRSISEHLKMNSLPTWCIGRNTSYRSTTYPDSEFFIVKLNDKVTFSFRVTTGVGYKKTIEEESDISNNNRINSVENIAIRDEIIRRNGWEMKAASPNDVPREQIREALALAKELDAKGALIFGEGLTSEAQVELAKNLKDAEEDVKYLQGLEGDITPRALALNFKSGNARYFNFLYERKGNEHILSYITQGKDGVKDEYEFVSESVPELFSDLENYFSNFHVNPRISKLLTPSLNKGLATPFKAALLDNRLAGRQLFSQEANGAVEGLYDVAADKILYRSDLDEATREAVLREELFHRGLRVLFGDRLGAELDRIGKLIPDKTRLGYDFGTDERLATEEWLAEKARRDPGDSIFREFMDFVKSLMAQVKRALGYNVPITDAEVRRFVAAGIRANVGRDGRVRQTQLMGRATGNLYASTHGLGTPAVKREFAIWRAVEDYREGDSGPDGTVAAVKRAVRLADKFKAKEAKNKAAKSKARRRGKSAIRMQIALAEKNGRLTEVEASGILSFIEGLHEKYLAGESVSLVQSEQSFYDAMEQIVTLGLKAPSDLIETAQHEFWHAMQQFLTDGEREKIVEDYVRDVKAFVEENPWFAFFIGKAQGQVIPSERALEWAKFVTQEEFEKYLRPVSGGYMINLPPEAYRLTLPDEYFVGRVLDLAEPGATPSTFKELVKAILKMLKDFFLGPDLYEAFREEIRTGSQGRTAGEAQVSPAMGRGDVLYAPGRAEYSPATRRITYTNKTNVAAFLHEQYHDFLEHFAGTMFDEAELATLDEWMLNTARRLPSGILEKWGVTKTELNALSSARDVSGKWPVWAHEVFAQAMESEHGMQEGGMVRRVLEEAAAKDGGEWAQRALQNLKALADKVFEWMLEQGKRYTASMRKLVKGELTDEQIAGFYLKAHPGLDRAAATVVARMWQSEDPRAYLVSLVNHGTEEALIVQAEQNRETASRVSLAAGDYEGFQFSEDEMKAFLADMEAARRPHPSQPREKKSAAEWNVVQAASGFRVKFSTVRGEFYVAPPSEVYSGRGDEAKAEEIRRFYKNDPVTGKFYSSEALAYKAMLEQAARAVAIIDPENEFGFGNTPASVRAAIRAKMDAGEMSAVTLLGQSRALGAILSFGVQDPKTLELVQNEIRRDTSVDHLCQKSAAKEALSKRGIKLDNPGLYSVTTRAAVVGAATRFVTSPENAVFGRVMADKSKYDADRAIYANEADILRKASNWILYHTRIALTPAQYAEMYGMEQSNYAGVDFWVGALLSKTLKIQIGAMNIALADPTTPAEKVAQIEIAQAVLVETAVTIDKTLNAMAHNWGLGVRSISYMRDGEIPLFVAEDIVSQVQDAVINQVADIAFYGLKAKIEEIADVPALREALKDAAAKVGAMNPKFLKDAQLPPDIDWKVVKTLRESSFRTKDGKSILQVFGKMAPVSDETNVAPARTWKELARLVILYAGIYGESRNLFYSAAERSIRQFDQTWNPREITVEQVALLQRFCDQANDAPNAAIRNWAAHGVSNWIEMTKGPGLVDYYTAFVYNNLMLAGGTMASNLFSGYNLVAGLLKELRNSVVGWALPLGATETERATYRDNQKRLIESVFRGAVRGFEAVGLTWKWNDIDKAHVGIAWSNFWLAWQGAPLGMEADKFSTGDLVARRSAKGFFDKGLLQFWFEMVWFGVGSRSCRAINAFVDSIAQQTYLDIAIEKAVQSGRIEARPAMVPWNEAYRTADRLLADYGDLINQVAPDWGRGNWAKSRRALRQHMAYMVRMDALGEDLKTYILGEAGQFNFQMAPRSRDREEIRGFRSVIEEWRKFTSKSAFKDRPIILAGRPGLTGWSKEKAGLRWGESSIMGARIPFVTFWLTSTEYSLRLLPTWNVWQIMRYMLSFKTPEKDKAVTTEQFRSNVLSLMTWATMFGLATTAIKDTPKFADTEEMVAWTHEREATWLESMISGAAGKEVRLINVGGSGILNKAERYAQQEFFNAKPYTLLMVGMEPDGTPSWVTKAPYGDSPNLRVTLGVAADLSSRLSRKKKDRKKSNEAMNIATSMAAAGVQANSLFWSGQMEQSPMETIGRLTELFQFGQEWGATLNRQLGREIQMYWSPIPGPRLQREILEFVDADFDVEDTIVAAAMAHQFIGLAAAEAGIIEKGPDLTGMYQVAPAKIPMVSRFVDWAGFESRESARGWRVAAELDWTINLPDKRIGVREIFKKGKENGKFYFEQVRTQPGVTNDYGEAVFTMEERAKAAVSASEEIGVMLQRTRKDAALQAKIEATYQDNQTSTDPELMTVTRRDLEQRMVNERVNAIFSWNLVEVYAERFKTSDPELYKSLMWLGGKMRDEMGKDWEAWERRK